MSEPDIHIEVFAKVARGKSTVARLIQDALAEVGILNVEIQDDEMLPRDVDLKRRVSGLRESKIVIKTVQVTRSGKLSDLSE